MLKITELPGDGDWRHDLHTTVLLSSKGKQLQDSMKDSYSKCQWGHLLCRTVRKHGHLWRVFTTVIPPLFIKSEDDLNGEEI